MVVISSTFSAPATGVLFQSSGTKLIINDQELGTATLYVTENNVVWGGGVLRTGGSAPTITLAYPHISLHAVQREPSPALYLVLSYELRVPQLQGGAGDAPAAEEDDDDDFDGDSTPITQLRFVPPNESDLTPLYQAMNQGQSLHPDPEDAEHYMDGEDIDEGDEEYEDAEDAASPEETAARLRDMRLGNGAPHYDDDEADEAIGDDE